MPSCGRVYGIEKSRNGIAGRDAGVERETGHSRCATSCAYAFQRQAAVCLYAALAADVSLDLIGAKDCLLIEGRFAQCEVFVRALASLRPDTAVYVARSESDASFGALRLVNPDLPPPSSLTRVAPLSQNLQDYRRRWRQEAARAE